MTTIRKKAFKRIINLSAKKKLDKSLHRMIANTRLFFYRVSNFLQLDPIENSEKAACVFGELLTV